MLHEAISAVRFSSNIFDEWRELFNALPVRAIRLSGSLQMQPNSQPAGIQAGTQDRFVVMAVAPVVPDAFTFKRAAAEFGDLCKIDIRAVVDGAR